MAGWLDGWSTYVSRSACLSVCLAGWLSVCLCVCKHAWMHVNMQESSHSKPLRAFVRASVK